MNRNEVGLASDLEIGTFMLGDLEIGKVFAGRELIIERDVNAMMTVCQQHIRIEDGKIYDMKLFMYDVRANGVMADVDISGYVEIFVDDSLHDEYMSRLRKTKLWRENYTYESS